ncbi:MAG: DUF3347 domain-containing protein [Bacteroidetes bacterium]|nr:DUF3347 domain-containing protein [Bacteroidota bacterium]
MTVKYFLTVAVIFSFAFPGLRSSSFLSADSVLTNDTSAGRFRIKSMDAELRIKFNSSEIAPLDKRILFNDFFRQYSGIKDALVYNDADGAGRKTLQLLDEMKSASDKITKENDDALWKIFILNYESIRSKAESLKFITEQRFMFGEISRGIVNLIRHYGLHDKTVYLLEYRDDSLNANQQWLSDKRDARNPFIGKMNDTLHTKVKEVWIFE